MFCVLFVDKLEDKLAKRVYDDEHVIVKEKPSKPNQVEIESGVEETEGYYEQLLKVYDSFIFTS